MIEFEGLNYLAIVAVWLINCAVGAYWYSPAGFAQQWNKLTGVDIMKIPEKQATKILLAVVGSALIQAFALGLVLNSLGADKLVDGLLTGLVLWLGFVTATTVGTALYQRRSWSFIWLNSTYFLVVIGIGSVVLTLWQ